MSLASALQFLRSISWLQLANSKCLWNALPIPLQDTAGYCNVLRYLLLQSFLSATVPGRLYVFAWCWAVLRRLFCSLVSLLTCSSACSWDPLPVHLVGGQKPVQYRATDSWAHCFPSESFIWKAHGTSVLLEAFSWHGALYSLSASATDETNC